MSPLLPRRAGVIGWPIEHSRSPLIHGHWLSVHGLAGRYERHPVRPEELEGFLTRLGTEGWVGCNVTLPHKEETFRLCAGLGAVLHPPARAVEACNTLWLDREGRLQATSTDAEGFLAHLAAALPGHDLRDRVATVLGAGGAARSIVHGLATAGVREIRLLNRTRERASELVRVLRLEGTAVALAWSERSEALAGSDLVVNATSLGMKGQPPLEIDLAPLAADAIVYDIVYVPLETPLLTAARRRGLTAIDGLGMLLHQAVPGFERWFGVRPSVTPELRALVVADIERPAR